MNTCLILFHPVNKLGIVLGAEMNQPCKVRITLVTVTSKGKALPREEASI